MKVDHITVGSSSSVRDTDDIWSETVEFFKPFQAGSITAEIDGTPLTCKVTVDGDIAVFDLMRDDSIVVTNICCFSKQSAEQTIQLTKQLIDKIGQRKSIPVPKADNFFITVIVNPFVRMGDLQLAGEIELYIYDAIRRGMEKRGSGNNNKKPDTPSGKPMLFEVGKRFPLEEYLYRGDMIVPLMNGAFFDVLSIMSQLTKEEIRLFRTGELETGVFVKDKVPFIYFDFGNFDFDISININKLPGELQEDWLNAQNNAITLYLVDAATGILEAQRMIGVNYGDLIRDTLETQTTLSIEGTEQIITNVQKLYSTAQMKAQAQTKMKFAKK